MKTRLVLLLVVLLVASCRWFRGEPAPDTSAAESSHVLKTPEELRAEEIEKKIAALRRRLPPSDNATRPVGGDNVAQALAVGPDVMPLPLPKPEPKPEPKPDPQPKAEAPAHTTATPTVEAVIAALEALPNKPPEQTFRLKALKALAGAKSEQELFARLYPVKDLKDCEQAWHDLVSALEACSRKQPDEALAELRDAERELVKTSSLRMSKPVFTRSILGLGNYEPAATSAFTRGRAVLVYFELADFVCRKKDNEWEYHLAREVVVMDLAGRTAATLANSDKTYTSRSCQRDLFWPLSFNVPKDLYPGEYILRITVTDKLKNQVVEDKLPFEIR